MSTDADDSPQFLRTAAWICALFLSFAFGCEAHRQGVADRTIFVTPKAEATK